MKWTWLAFMSLFITKYKSLAVTIRVFCQNFVDYFFPSSRFEWLSVVFVVIYLSLSYFIIKFDSFITLKILFLILKKKLRPTAALFRSIEIWSDIKSTFADARYFLVVVTFCQLSVVCASRS